MRDFDMVSEREVADFSAYLKLNGAEILEKTNPWELIRYRMDECGVVVGYFNSRGRMKLPPVIERHLGLFRANKSIVRHERLGFDSKKRTRRKLFERDGDECFYCGYFLQGQRSIEHLVNISDGGSNNLGNLVLTHDDCNHTVGDLPLVEKLKVRERARRSDTPPWDHVNLLDHLEETAA